nr:MAG TPA: hypothetical protein [Caudoviricetes sp.]
MASAYPYAKYTSFMSFRGRMFLPSLRAKSMK